MKTYPVMLDLRGRGAVVVGGGSVGLRKVRSLRDAGARVTLICQAPPAGGPGAGAGAGAGAEAGAENLHGVTVICEPYRREFLDGAMLVFACTDDRAVNAAIAADARKCGAWVNAADQPEDCDFFLPAAVRDGDVVVAVGTGGLAPALAADLKRRLANALPKRIGEFAALLAELREELKGKVAESARRGRIMRQLADEATYHAFLADGPDAVRERLDGLLGRRLEEQNDGKETFT